MAPQTVTVTVKYSKPGTQPPIFLAGSFSAWQPQEMEFTTSEDNEHEFHKKVEVEQGKEYQYKFRIGVGDWWTLNEDSPTVTDDIGNKNNLLSIPKVEETVAETKESQSTTQEPQAEPAEPTSTQTMEKETTPSIEETMGTRETDDTLFADEIMKDTEQPEQELNTPAVEGQIEPHSTPAIPEKLQAEDIEEVKHVEAPEEPKQELKAPVVEGRIEPHSTPAIPEKPQAEDVGEVKHVKELQEIGGTDNCTSNLDKEEELIEPVPTPLVNIKKIQDLEDTDSKDVSDMDEDKGVEPPVLVVESAETEEQQDEKVDIEESTMNGHSSDRLLTTDATKDDTSRVGAHTPDLASVAAEVADTAATLDPEPPTPPISDDEAGRIGFRRMSLTPIPRVASTAAEVADVAAIIDKEPEEEEEPREFIRPFDTDDGDLPETPPNEKVPRFSHELCSPPDHKHPLQHEEDFDPYEGMRPRKEEEEEIDLNDPSIQMFPSDRAGILEHLRQMQQRLPEDEVKHEDLDLSPPSPVVGPNGRSGRLNLPEVSPVVLAQRSPSPSLDSIPEQNDEGNDLLGAKLVKLNGEDKPASNGVTVPKEDFDAVITNDIPAPKKEKNETPLLDPEKKTRGLNGFVDGSDENLVKPDTEGAETNVSVAEDTTKNDALEALKTTDKAVSPEIQAEESKGTAPADIDKAKNPIPEVKTPDVLIEEHATKHDSEASMDGICEEGSHIVPGPATPLIVVDRQLGHDEEYARQLRAGTFGPSITLQPATPLPGVDRQLGHDDEQVKEPATKDLGSSDEHTDKGTTKEDSPNIMVSPATPSSSATTDTTVKHNDVARSTAVQGENDDARDNLRKRQPSPTRSVAKSTTNSMRSGSGKDPKDIKGGTMLRVFMTGVVAMAAFASAMYYFDMIPASLESTLQHLHIPGGTEAHD